MKKHVDSYNSHDWSRFFLWVLVVQEQKLLLDIAILEVEVLNLEMQITGLQWRLVQETSIEDDEVVEDLHISTSPPSFFQQRNTQQVSPVAGGAALYAASHSLQLSGGGFKSPALATLKELLHVPCPLMEGEEEKEEEEDEEPPSPSPPRRSFWSRWNGQDLLCRSARPSVRKVKQDSYFSLYIALIPIMQGLRNVRSRCPHVQCVSKCTARTPLNFTNGNQGLSYSKTQSTLCFRWEVF